MIEKVKKLSNPEFYTLSSEPLRIQSFCVYPLGGCISLLKYELSFSSSLKNQLLSLGNENDLMSKFIVISFNLVKVDQTALCCTFL
jgi:hypothetical protein